MKNEIYESYPISMIFLFNLLHVLTITFGALILVGFGMLVGIVYIFFICGIYFYETEIPLRILFLPQ